MPAVCNIKNCKSRQKDPGIQFHRFPFQDRMSMRYWIAATGRKNWMPYQNARICSLHFRDIDYYHNAKCVKKRRLKPDVIPTQNVHADIVQILQQAVNTSHMVYEAEPCDPNNATSAEETVFLDKENECDPNNAAMHKQTNVIIEDFRCSNYNALVRENEKLKQKLEEVITTREEHLNRQANVLRDIMNYEATQLKKKVNMAQDKIRTLNKTIRRKNRTITNLKTLFKHLKNINALEDDTVF